MAVELMINGKPASPMEMQVALGEKATLTDEQKKALADYFNRIKDNPDYRKFRGLPIENEAYGNEPIGAPVRLDDVEGSSPDTSNDTSKRGVRIEARVDPDGGPDIVSVRPLTDDERAGKKSPLTPARPLKCKVIPLNQSETT